MKSTITIGAALVALAGMLVFTVPLAWWSAFWMQYLWGWFVAPTFDVPVPSIWMLAGLILMGRFLVRRSDSESKNKDLSDHLTEFGVFGVIAPPLVTSFGWIFHQFAQ